VTRGLCAQRIAQAVILHACRGLPDDIRDERFREWAAELPAIMCDSDIRFAILRSARALSYAAGTYRSVRYLRRAAGKPRTDGRQSGVTGDAAVGWASRSRRHPLAPPRYPDGVLPAIAAVVIWLILIVLVRAYQPQGPVIFLYISAGILVDILAVVAIVRFIRWIRRQSKHPPRS